MGDVQVEVLKNGTEFKPVLDGAKRRRNFRGAGPILSNPIFVLTKIQVLFL